MQKYAVVLHSRLQTVVNIRSKLNSVGNGTWREAKKKKEKKKIKKYNYKNVKQHENTVLRIIHTTKKGAYKFHS